MNTETLTPERILDATEDVLRRFGPNKATVVDVARELGVSHGSVYRHFASKNALRDAVAARWLHELSAPLTRLLEPQGAAAANLRRWFDALLSAKRQRALDDPQLFETYVALANASRDVVEQHVNELLAMIEGLVSKGIASGEFKPGDAAATALALYHATSYFHKPAFATHWQEPTIDSEFDALWELLIRGLLA